MGKKIPKAEQQRAKLLREYRARKKDSHAKPDARQKLSILNLPPPPTSIPTYQIISSPPQRQKIPYTNFTLPKARITNQKIPDYLAARMSGLDRLFFQATLQNKHQDFALEVAKSLPDSLNPRDTSFCKIAWLYEKFIMPQQDYARDLINGKPVNGARIKPLLEECTEHCQEIREELNFDKFTRDDCMVDSVENTRIGQILCDKVLIPLDLICSETGMGFGIGAIAPELIEDRNIDDLNFRIKRLFTLEGNFGEGIVKGNEIFLPVERFLDHEIFYENWKLWYEELKKGSTWPSISENPHVFLHWINMLSFGRDDLLPSISNKEEDTLAEEISHEMTDRYCEAKLISETIGSADLPNKLPDKNATGDGIKFLKAVLKDTTIKEKLDTKQTTSIDSADEYSHAMFEVEAKLQAFQRTPTPFITFADATRGIITIQPPNMWKTDSNDIPEEDERYATARVLLSKVLTEELLPNGAEISTQVDWDALESYDFKDEGSTEAFQEKWSSYLREESNDTTGIMLLRKAWFEFFQKEISTEEKFDNFVNSRRLQDAAKRAHDKLFLSQAERDESLSNWKEIYTKVAQKQYGNTQVQ